MKGSRWREVTCLQHFQSELPIREFETIKHYKNFIRTQTRCTVLPLTALSHKQGLIIADLSSCNPWTNVELLTCQRTSVAFFSTIWVPWTGRVNSGDQRTWTSLLPKVKSSMSQICHFSENSGETTTRMWFWQQRRTSTQELFPKGLFASCGNQVKKTTKKHMRRSVK